jgi:hypothetical protein
MIVGLAVVLGAVIASFGQLQSRGGLGDQGFGVYSMNLLSPFLPQRSGLIPPLRDVMVDATGGQYEGFSYLGGGVLLLLCATGSWQLRTFRLALCRHPWLWSLFLCCTLFALSNKICFGGEPLFYLPVPRRVLQLASVFRSSGRFFWPVMYCMTALAIAAVIPYYGRRGAILLCIAALLQWIDTAPLRDAFASSIRGPAPTQIALADWEAAIIRHRSVRVLPQYACLSDSESWNGEVAVQLQLLAAFADLCR